MSSYEVVRPIGQGPAPQRATTVRPERRWGVEDVAAYLDIPVRTLYQWRMSGYGPRGRRVGRHLRYDPGEVEAWFLALDDPAAG